MVTITDKTKEKVVWQAGEEEFADPLENEPVMVDEGVKKEDLMV